MKLLKKIFAVLGGLFILYVIYLYVFGLKQTFLFPARYSGAFIIIANQPDGVDVDPNNVVYDFTKGNVIKIKGDLITGVSPWGYLNYYAIGTDRKKHKIVVIDDPKFQPPIKDSTIYVWDFSIEVGSCKTQGYPETFYETICMGKYSLLDSSFNERGRLLRQYGCRHGHTPSDIDTH
jgi:hypothetical protein